MTSKLVLFLLVITFLFNSGCDWFSHSSSSLTEENNKQTNASATSQIDNITTPSTPAIQETIAISSFGSPNCNKAIEDPKVQIKNFKFSSNGMSYSWASSTKLEVWGISDPHNADALACAGYLKDGKFKCAKFDWISSDRTTRNWKNIKEAYNGFDSTAFFAAKKHCFFIMSKDGKKRSNIIID